MPLSEYEQRVLHQMEQQLRSDDPHLAESFTPQSSFSVRRLALGALLVLLGLSCLVAGVALSHVWLGVLGFLVMLGGVLFAASRSTSEAPEDGQAAPPRSGSPAGNGGSSSFMRKMEDRWDDRRERGA